MDLGSCDIFGGNFVVLNSSNSQIGDCTIALFGGPSLIMEESAGTSGGPFPFYILSAMDGGFKNLGGGM